MGAPKPQYVANLIVESGNNYSFKKLEDVTFDLLKSNRILSSDEAIWDYIEQYNSDIARELFIKIDDRKKDGVTLNFELKEDIGDYYIEFYSKPEIELLRNLQLNTPEYFEYFCKRILDGLGGNSIVTGGTNDGGIDFISTDILLNKLPSQSTKGSNILVVGQAKRYTKGNQVCEKEIREFVGASIKKVDELKKTRSEQFGILQPVIYAFWTTSDFNSIGREYAKNIGIWYLNGVALCQLALQLGIDE